MSGADIVVAGAGAIGATAALVLARAGHRVTVLDPAPARASASGVAAGMLAPAFEALFDPAASRHFELLAAARDLWPAMAQTVGLSLTRRGALAVAAPAESQRWAERLAAIGASARVLAPEEARGLAPGLRPGLAGVFTSDDWRLEPLQALSALRRAATAAGACFLSRRLAGYRAGRALAAGEGGIAADFLIMATGASQSLAELAPELAMLTPVKGQILRAAVARPAGPVVRGAGVYLCPGEDELVLGASMEIGRRDVDIDPAVVADLIARASYLDPGLTGLDWRSQAGVRAATPDGLPLVGAGREPGVVLAVGARRNGWLLAPLIAQSVLAVVEAAPPDRFAGLFDPRRAMVTVPG